MIIKFRDINGFANSLFIDEVRIQEGPVAITEIPEKNVITIYPNPVTEYATIKTNVSLENGELIIYNILGEKMARMQGISGNEIRISSTNLPAGNYFFQLKENNELAGTGKFIVQ